MLSTLADVGGSISASYVSSVVVTEKLRRRMPFGEKPLASVTVEAQDFDPPWDPVMLAAQMPKELQELLTEQDYQAIKNEFDKGLKQLVFTQESMMGFGAFMVFSILALIGSLVAAVITIGTESLVWFLIFGVLMLAFVCAAGYYRYHKWKEQLVSQRRRQYEKFLAEVNANFPQMRWELNEENGASNVSFNVLAAKGVAQATVPVVAAVVVGASPPRDNANYV
eukprot:Skav233754  [mRNA]  locus=scaffold1792:307263:319705:- [translate_table: standard]